MVSPKADERPRTPADPGSEAKSDSTFMTRHGGTLLPVMLLLGFAALMVWGMYGPR